MKLKISKIITTLLIIGLIIKVLSVFIAQDYLLMKDTVTEGFRIENTITYIADLFLFSSGLLAIRYEGKYFKNRIKNIYLILIVLIVFVYLKSGASLFNPSTFFSVKGIGPWLGLSILFTASNSKRFKLVSKVLLFLAAVLAINAVINIGKLGIGFSRKDAMLTLRIISINLMWVSFIIVFLFFKKHKIIVATIFLISFLTSLVIATRSFLLLHILTLIYFTIKFIKRKLFLYLSFLFISVIFVITYNYLPDDGFIMNSSSLLENRMNKDSRTEQYVEFFENTNATDFIFGAGTFSEWNQGGTMYSWLDNQVILTAWWAGILPVILYLTLLIIPIKKYFFKKNIENEIHSFSFIILLWLLALSGISIFIAISTSLYFYIISFILGRLLSKKKIKIFYAKK